MGAIAAPRALACLAALLLCLWPQRCVAPTAAPDLNVLLSLYNLTNGTQWRDGFTWTKGVGRGLDPCDSVEFFKGLDCSGNRNDPDRRVTNLWLSAMYLQGPLPQNFGDMTMLEEIYLTMNNLTGTLPETMCNMTRLMVLDISQNNFSGVIPDCVGRMAKLQKVDVRSNNLEGTIPAGFGLLIELQELYLSDNHLLGTIPRDLFDAKRIENMFLSYNELVGTVPRVWGRYKIKETTSMQGLSWMDLRGNHLEGTYPDIIALLGAV
mmetsp:Transcript_49645/g.121197  ORF Transcript_49645/g.121197 Transcript_49645/m.121197 type:complete len:265 (-) Transcript_49645:296-1090(-)